ncbi:MAG: hypothetical protein JWM74_3607 [Myxococcaceae bacterium]|nr:hypothetical protein [Myxococcaceae bacterium]
MTRSKLWVFGGAGAALVLGSFVVASAWKKKPPPDEKENVTVAAPSSTNPTASAFLSRMLDAGPPRDSGPPAIIDAGTSACRILSGPLQQPFTGPATLAATATGIDLVIHKNGIVKVLSFPAEPIASVKPTGRRSLDGTTDKASKPPCAVAGPFAFCSDANGDIHRALRAQASDEVVAKAEPGARVGAAAFPGGHIGVAWLEARKTTEGRLSEAFMRVDDGPPVRISEDGAGATEFALAERNKEVIALFVDARRAMTPLHARPLTVSAAGKLGVGTDAVIYVGGGSDHQVLGALATNGKGSLFALIPTSSEDGFGLASVHVGSPPKIDEAHTFSLYPNGLDTAPVVATRSGAKMYVARVRPLTADPTASRVLELGRLDDAGTFTSLGLVPTNGSVKDVAVEADGLGAIWLHYTDGVGSWLERRVCADP